jgi:hypothetical protein
MAIPHECWADYAFKAPRYGQHTSNLVEQQNWVYIQAREKPVLDMFTHIWRDMQGKLFRRSLAATATMTPLSINATLLYRQAEDSARLFDVVPSSYTSGLVFLRQDSNIGFKVELFFGQGEAESTGSCTCGKFQNDRMPCPHGLAFLHQQRFAPMQFIAQFNTKDAWMATYQQPLPTLLQSDLKIDMSVLPPLVKKKRGRPQKKRREQGQGAGGGPGAGSQNNGAGPLAAAAAAPAPLPVVQAAGVRQARQRRRFQPWVYIVDVPRLQAEVHSRTRSGAV